MWSIKKGNDESRKLKRLSQDLDKLSEVTDNDFVKKFWILIKQRQWWEKDLSDSVKDCYKIN